VFLKTTEICWVPVAHACNPSYFGSEFKPHKRRKEREKEREREEGESERKRERGEREGERWREGRWKEERKGGRKEGRKEGRKKKTKPRNSSEFGGRKSKIGTTGPKSRCRQPYGNLFLASFSFW
jgi:hypothetical protein